MTRVQVGDVRKSAGREWVVLSVGRGRPGEDRAMYVIGERVGNVVMARETRGHSVREWPLVGRLRLRVTRTDSGTRGEVLP